VLRDLVRRVASVDFVRREALAHAYAKLVRGEPLTIEATAELLTPASTEGIDDIVMGAMIELGVASVHLEAFRRLVKRADDPWFEIVLAQAEAAADAQHGAWRVAEARLRGADGSCLSPSVIAPCLDLALQRGRLYKELYRTPKAAEVLRTALGVARTAGAWRRAGMLLQELAEVARVSAAPALARAYGREGAVLRRQLPAPVRRSEPDDGVRGR
jgi:hypothetical protein